MNKKEIIILAAMGIGVYILSQVKAMKTYFDPLSTKAAAQTVREKVAEKVDEKIDEEIQEEDNEYMPERRPVLPATPIAKKIAQEIPDAATFAARKRMAEKILLRKRTAEKVAQKIAEKVAEKVAQKTTVPTLRLEPKRSQLGQLIFLKKTAIAAAQAVEQAPTSLPIAQVIFLKKAAANAAQAAAQALAAFQQKIHGLAFPRLFTKAAPHIVSKAATQRTVTSGAAIRPGLDWKTFLSTSSVMKIRDPMARMKKILEAKRLGKIPLLGSTRRIAIPISPMQAIRDRITRAAARKKAQKEAAARSKPPHRIAIPISPMQAIRDVITRAAARKKAQKEAAQQKSTQKSTSNLFSRFKKKETANRRPNFKNWPFLRQRRRYRVFR